MIIYRRVIERNKLVSLQRGVTWYWWCWIYNFIFSNNCYKLLLFVIAV